MRVPWGDRDNGYGWISIALHWLTAAAILALLFAGDSIAVSGEARSIHTTIGVSAWLILAVRVAWRLWQGHPRAPGMNGLSFHVGAVVHYALLAGIVLMLVSGPVTAWASGGLDVFGWRIPGAAPTLPDVYSLGRMAHIAGAWILGIGTLLHVLGVLKHMFVDRDHTLDRIMVPPSRGG